MSDPLDVWYTMTADERLDTNCRWQHNGLWHVTRIEQLDYGYDSTCIAIGRKQACEAVLRLVSLAGFRINLAPSPP